MYIYIIIICKNLNYSNYKIHSSSSCEIEDFVETHFCKLCVILRSRVLRVVCPHYGYRSATPLGTTRYSSVACTGVNRVMLINLCAETIKPVFEGDKI